MSSKKSNLESLIREYLLDEGVLREKLSSSNFDFGFVISYPPGPKGQNISVYKPKNKKSIFITIRLQLSEKRVNALNSLKPDKQFQFFDDVRKFFIVKEIYFTIDIQNFGYEIHEQVYLENDGFVSKDTLFKRIQKLFYCLVFSNLLLDKYCLGKDMSPTKFSPEFDLSLYS